MRPASGSPKDQGGDDGQHGHEIRREPSRGDAAQGTARRPGRPVSASPAVHSRTAAPGRPGQVEEQARQDEEERAGRKEVETAHAGRELERGRDPRRLAAPAEAEPHAPHRGQQLLARPPR